MFMSISNLAKTLSIVTAGSAFIAFGAVDKAEAAFITSQSDPALSGTKLIDFESVIPGSYTSLTIGDVNFSTSLGEVEFVNADYAGEFNTEGQSLQNTYAVKAFNNLKINFLTPTETFGFNWGASNASWTLTAFDSSNNILDSQVLPIVVSSNAGDFFGIKNVSAPISYATLVASEFGDYVLIDNLKSKSVSVPEPLNIAGTGLVGAMGLWLNRKKVTTKKV